MNRHVKKFVVAVAATILIGVPVFAIVGGDLDTANEYPNVGAIIATDHPRFPRPRR